MEKQSKQLLFLRETVRRTRDYIRDNQTVVCLAKGIEKNTLKTMYQIIAASENPQSAMYIQEIFSSLTLRVYTHNDVNDVVSGIISPSKALIALMAREKKAEII